MVFFSSWVYKVPMRCSLAALLTTPLALFPVLASASLPDLCDDVYLGPTGAPIVDSTGMCLSRFCSWTNELAVSPWADHVCCTISGSPSSASCTPTDSMGRCVTGYKMWCDYAVLSGGSVTCQQAWPDACTEGLCSSVLPQGATPMMDTESLCCTDVDVCTVIDPENIASCAGKYVGCDAPFTNVDGSVGCSDDE